MSESWRSWLTRWYFNFFPAYRGTGGRITYVASDYSEVKIRLPLNRRTQNYVGTIFGGSMYASVDPFFMIMLLKRLGSDYIVWDKGASICFKKPGRSTLYSHFFIDQTEIEYIKKAAEKGPLDRVYHCDLVDREGIVHASVEKTVYIRRKEKVA